MKTTIRNKDIEIIVKIDLTQLGYQKPYFSITGEVYPADKPATKRNLIASGCCHDAIQAITNEFDDIIALHLSDIDGQPLHPLENGFYHYAEGINEDGTPVYFKNEEERQKAEETRSQYIYREFLKRTKLENTAFANEAFRALSSHRYLSDTEKKLPENYYKNCINQIEKEYKKSYVLVKERNNKALAHHLRISIKEAEAIPAGLTKQQFNERYIKANTDRWKQEADAAIKKYNLCKRTSQG